MNRATHSKQMNANSKPEQNLTSSGCPVPDRLVITDELKKLADGFIWAWRGVLEKAEDVDRLLSLQLTFETERDAKNGQEILHALEATCDPWLQCVVERDQGSVGKTRAWVKDRLSVLATPVPEGEQAVPLPQNAVTEETATTLRDELSKLGTALGALDDELAKSSDLIRNPGTAQELVVQALHRIRGEKGRLLQRANELQAQFLKPRKSGGFRSSVVRLPFPVPEDFEVAQVSSASRWSISGVPIRVFFGFPDILDLLLRLADSNTSPETCSMAPRCWETIERLGRLYTDALLRLELMGRGGLDWEDPDYEEPEERMKECYGALRKFCRLVVAKPAEQKPLGPAEAEGGKSVGGVVQPEMVKESGEQSRGSADETGRVAKKKFLFRQAGSICQVVFEESPVFHIENTLGAKYLDYLLHHPNRPVSTFDLEVPITPEKGAARLRNSLQRESDPQALREYRQELGRDRKSVV